MRTSIVVIVMILLAYTIIHNSNSNHKETLQSVDNIRKDVSNVRSDLDNILLKYMSKEQLDRAKKVLNERPRTTETNQERNQ